MLGEFLFIVIIGALQPVTELSFGTRAAAIYNVVAAIVVLGYVAWRLIKRPALWKEWGLRFDNVRSAIPPYAAFSVIAVIVVYGIGWYLGNTPLPISFWYLLALYPVWGIAQQFVVQNFVARNLQSFIAGDMDRALLTALLFAFAHAPSFPLMLLTFVAGFCWTLLYQRHPNLFVLGIAHGILGALVFYLVLGQDQMEILRQYFVR